jgi:hypothetical protein
MLKECPGGHVSEDRLRNIYLQFFPQGGKRPLLIIGMDCCCRHHRHV